MATQYCSVTCLKDDWKAHKAACKSKTIPAPQDQLPSQLALNAAFRELQPVFVDEGMMMARAAGINTDGKTQEEVTVELLTQEYSQMLQQQ